MNRRISNKEFRRKNLSTKFDLEERLIKFAVKVLEVAEMLPSSYAGKHFAGQLVRAGSSPALNYGEAQSAESRKDFIHKMKVALKELRESHICMQIILRKPLLKETALLKEIISENNELISIFVKSIATAKKNSK